MAEPQADQAQNAHQHTHLAPFFWMGFAQIPPRRVAWLDGSAAGTSKKAGLR
jgi:hypothetical protein